MSETKVYETFDGKTKRTYMYTVGDILSDLGERPVSSITLIDEEAIETKGDK